MKRVLVYDPLFRLEEKKSLIELGCQCILDNEVYTFIPAVMNLLMWIII